MSKVKVTGNQLVIFDPPCVRMKWVKKAAIGHDDIVIITIITHHIIFTYISTANPKPNQTNRTKSRTFTLNRVKRFLFFCVVFVSFEYIWMVPTSKCAQRGISEGCGLHAPLPIHIFHSAFRFRCEDWRGFGCDDGAVAWGWRGELRHQLSVVRDVWLITTSRVSIYERLWEAFVIEECVCLCQF